MWVNNRVVICSTQATVQYPVTLLPLGACSSVLHQVNRYLLRTSEVSTSPLT